MKGEALYLNSERNTAIVSVIIVVVENIENMLFFANKANITIR